MKTTLRRHGAALAGDGAAPSAPSRPTPARGRPPRAGARVRPRAAPLARHVATALVGAALLAGCSPKPPAESRPIPIVQVVEPMFAPTQAESIYTGRLEAVQKVMLRARVSGYLQAIRFRDGEPVRAGAPLFDLDPATFEAARDRDAGNLRAAQARQTLARQKSGRDGQLRQAGAVSIEAVQQSTADAAGADAEVAVAAAQLKATTLDLSYTHVTAPIDGLLSDRRVDVGNFVSGGSGQGTLLATIVTLDPIRITFDVTEADYQRLARAGLPAHRLTLPVEIGDETGWPRRATLEFANNEEDRDSGTIRLRAVLPNPDHALLPGLFARVRLPLGQPTSAASVPDAAILSDQSRRFVLVVDADSKVEPRPVVPGALDGTRRIVLAGLAPHDRVIVDGLAKVRPGDTVKVGQAAAPGGK
ncbi:efflux RND transporter periplasmic adaptor subunit [Burkholderia plantarii]|uniref:Acriflavine resistance protein A n=1 Tax=Burkholderia plantarii TaxID=41899 RepID=A0A0B6S8U5_BURPL|nr:efflux RND transporter periplasmic adaptor subunit [Burkholderia plantarii]AJK48681.1 acriflavine resistance protein A [Burkholderia plantarii]